MPTPLDNGAISSDAAFPTAPVAMSEAFNRLPFRCEADINTVQTQCTVLTARLELVKRSISNERDKQKDLRERLSSLRGGVRSASGSPPARMYTLHCKFWGVDKLVS